MGQNTLFDEYRSPVHVLSSRLLILALVPGVIGLASEHWLAAPWAWAGSGFGSRPGGSGQLVRHVGLWAVCSNFSRCAGLPSSEFPDAYGPVRGMGVTAMCLHVLSVLVGVVCSCEDPDNLLGVNVYVPRLEEVLAVVAGILMGGALGIFATSTQRHLLYQTFHLDWSFWLLLIYVCLLFLAGGVIILVRFKCACRKRPLCFRHRQKTTCCFGTPARSLTQSADIVQARKEKWSLDEPLKETNFKFFLEPVKTKNARDSDASAKASEVRRNENLERVKGSDPVYSSLEGIPRVVVRLLEKPEETDTV